MTTIRTAAATAALAVGLLTPLALGAPAHAGDDDDRVERSGTCSDGARWKIKAKQDDGRIEVEAEIDSNQAGQRWTWTLRHDGGRAASGTSRTTARSGSFEVERKVVDQAGQDTFVLRARHAGQRCVARVAY